MKTVGLIVEYNPFHNGHQWHAEQARRLSGDAGVVAVMSGHFLQRGEPASFDKWLRAKMAVSGGVDLVIELPTVFAVRSAQYFAAGGIRLLESLGIVNYVCFGAESDNLDLLKQAAAASSQYGASQSLLANMKKGETYAKAFSRSVSELTGIDATLLSSPNNILAIEYLRAIEAFAPDIFPLVVKRKQAHYHETQIKCSIASATAIRKSLEECGGLTGQVIGAVPHSTAEILEFALTRGLGPVSTESLALPLLYLLRSLSVDQLGQYPEISEGLHHKLASISLQARSIEELLTLLKSKRYTRTRLQRMLMHILLGTKKKDMELWDETGPLYARVLAFNDTGRNMLKEIASKGSVPLITKTAAVLNTRNLQSGDRNPLQHMLAIDIRASDIYALALPNFLDRAGGWDFHRSPVYIPETPATV